MGRVRTLARAVSIGFASLLCIPDARGVEGAFGRSITGQQITPYAGVLPTEPGFFWSLGYLHYEGETGVDNQAPTGGQIASNLEATFDLTPVTGVFVWPTPQGRWNYASALVVPYAWADVSAGTVTGPVSFDMDDHNSGMFDITIVPLIASFQASETEHWSFGLYVAAPTGAYNEDRLANVGLNNWTFSPTFGYTKLFDEGVTELSLQAAVDVFTENRATNYHNGEVFRAELLLMRRLHSKFGFGAVLGWIEQTSDDDAPSLPDSLEGFRQHVVGGGPALAYTHYFSDASSLDVNFRWIFEFDAKNSLQGHGAQISFGWSL